MPVNPAPYAHDGEVVKTLLSNMAAAASLALAQTPKGVPNEAGLWHDRPVEDCDNGLYLWVENFTAMLLGDFPNEAVTNPRCMPVNLNPRVMLSLRRPCAPIPDESGNVLYADELSSAENMIVDARALMCGVYSAWPPLLEANYGAGIRINWGSMVPTGFNSNVFGWDWSITLELDNCRDACQ